MYCTRWLHGAGSRHDSCEALLSSFFLSFAACMLLMDNWCYMHGCGNVNNNDPFTIVLGQSI